MKNKKIIIISLFLLMAITLIFIFSRDNVIEAYYIHKANLIDNVTVGEIKASINEEKYKDVQILKPNSVIENVPYLSNTGEIDGYIRAQVYVPVANIKYIEIENEKEIVKRGEKELVKIIQKSESEDVWQKVTEERFNGQVQDEKGNKYNVYTFKYMKEGNEQIVKNHTKISIPVFNSIEVINYLDLEKAMNLKVIVKAIAVQTQDGKDANKMWEYYINQNGGSGVGEVK